jgi:hypothetical protein
MREQLVSCGLEAQDLKALACVSRALSDMALDVLWARQFRLGPLMDLLPSNAIESRKNPMGRFVRVHLLQFSCRRLSTMFYTRLVFPSCTAARRPYHIQQVRPTHETLEYRFLSWRRQALPRALRFTNSLATATSSD